MTNHIIKIIKLLHLGIDVTEPISLVFTETLLGVFWFVGLMITTSLSTISAILAWARYKQSHESEKSDNLFIAILQTILAALLITSIIFIAVTGSILTTVFIQLIMIVVPLIKSIVSLIAAGVYWGLAATHDQPAARQKYLEYGNRCAVIFLLNAALATTFILLWKFTAIPLAFAAIPFIMIGLSGYLIYKTYQSTKQNNTNANTNDQEEKSYELDQSRKISNNLIPINTTEEWMRHNHPGFFNIDNDSRQIDLLEDADNEVQELLETDKALEKIQNEISDNQHTTEGLSAELIDIMNGNPYIKLVIDRYHLFQPPQCELTTQQIRAIMNNNQVTVR